jgi:selenocysteine-specific elongation factor
MVLAENGTLRATQIIDTEVEVLTSSKKPLRSRQRVRISIGTVEALARIQVLNYDGEIEPGRSDLVQFSLETPVVAVPDEKFIIRSYSPQATIAGGRVLDPLPVRHRRKDVDAARAFLQKLAAAKESSDAITLILEEIGEEGASFGSIQARTGIKTEALRHSLQRSIEAKSVVKAYELFIGRTAFEKLKSKTIEAIAHHHRSEPLSKGIQRETLREKVFAHLEPGNFRAVLQSLESEHAVISEGDSVRLAAYDLKLSSGDAEIRARFEKIYQERGFEVPKLDDALTEAIEGTRFPRDKARKIFQLLINDGLVVKISDDFYFSRSYVDTLKSALRKFADGTSDRLIDVPKFKDIAGISRKYAIPLLEYFDREKFTRREGDKRLIL